MDDALAAARLSLADYKLPVMVLQVDAIPITSLTKVDRAAINRLFGEQADRVRRFER